MASHKFKGLALALLVAGSSAFGSIISDFATELKKTPQDKEGLIYMETNWHKLEGLTAAQKKADEGQLTYIVARYAFTKLYAEDFKEAIEAFKDPDCKGNICLSGLGQAQYKAGNCSGAYKNLGQALKNGLATTATIDTYYTVVIDGSCVIESEDNQGKYFLGPFRRYYDSVNVLEYAIKSGPKKDRAEYERMLKENRAIIMKKGE